jgi:hypothetical protein
MGSYVVQPTDPPRFAGAVVRYEVDRPQVWAPVVVGVLLFAGGGLLTGGPLGALLGAFVCLAIAVGAIGAKRRRLTQALATHGYRPGSTLKATFGADGFVVRNGPASAEHAYREIADARLRDGVVVIRLAETGRTLPLPVELVPEERWDTLARAAGRDS